jgi:ceramide glucosyltransferase
VLCAWCTSGGEGLAFAEPASDARNAARCGVLTESHTQPTDGCRRNQQPNRVATRVRVGHELAFASSMIPSLELFGAAIIIVIAAYHLLLAVHAKRRAPAAPTAWPSVAVLRPIRGRDPGARENLDALLEVDYPGEIEFVFLLEDENDPSYPLVEAALAAHTARPARIVLTGAPPPNRTGKINSMIQGTELVHADVLAFSDSDTRPQRGALRELVALLVGDPRNGIAFAPTVAVASDAKSGDVGYELLVNAWYGAAIDRLADDRGTVPFAMGQFMAIRASALDAIGTMRAAEGELVDDMFLGRRMIESGFTNVISTTRVPLVIGGMRLGEFLSIFRKWIFFSQSGLPEAFKTAGWLRAVPGLGAWGTLVAGIALSSGPVIAIGLAALALFTASQVRLNRALGGAVIALRHYWIAATLPFIAAGVALSTKLNHTVAWRGRRYSLDDTGRLRAS